LLGSTHAFRLNAAAPSAFKLPDDGGTMRRLSQLQDDNAMILILGRGEHCPRERQHQREMVWFHQWCTVAFTELVTVLPNDLHDTNKMRIATGVYWPFLADADLHVQRSLQIGEYTDPIVTRRCRTRSSWPPAGDRQDVRRLLVLGTALARAALGALQDLLRRTKADFDLTLPEVYAARKKANAAAPVYRPNARTTATKHSSDPGNQEDVMKGLRGKVAVVTGGSSGIGQAIAIRLGEEGVDVAINYVGPVEGAEETTDAIKHGVDICMMKLSESGTPPTVFRA
jgi:hypothetical protein